MNKSIWLPHLILQRGLGVKDFTQVNFKADLIEHSLSGKPTEMWQPQEIKPDLMTDVQSIDNPKDPRLDNKRGQYFDKGARENYLIEEFVEYDKKTKTSLIESIKNRGDRVDFTLLGYKTFLFQTEYDLIKDVVDRIEEITILTTFGLSPLFKIYAKLKDV